MKRTKLMRNIDKKAKVSGVPLVFIREGSRHEVWQFGTLRVSIPRHQDINELTAKAILSDIDEEAR